MDGSTFALPASRPETRGKTEQNQDHGSPQLPFFAFRTQHFCLAPVTPPLPPPAYLLASFLRGTRTISALLSTSPRCRLQKRLVSQNLPVVSACIIYRLSLFTSIRPPRVFSLRHTSRSPRVVLGPLSSPSEFLCCETRRALQHLQRDTSLVAPLTSQSCHPDCTARRSIATALPSSAENPPPDILRVTSWVFSHAATAY